MIIKEKRWLSRIVAMLCVLTMVVGVLTPASVGVAATFGKKITIPIMENVIYYDEDGAPMVDNLSDDGYCTTDMENYKYKYDNSKKNIIIEPTSETFNKNVILYLGTSNIPKVTYSATDISETSLPTRYVDDWYMVTIGKGIFKSSMTEITLSIGQKYSVTYSVGDNCIVTDILGSKSLSGQTVTYDGKVEFKALLENSVKDSKELSVKLLKLDGTEDKENLSNDKDGKYTINSLQANMKVTVTAVDKTFNVQEASSNTKTGYTYTSYDGKNEVAYDGTFRFYVTPEEGYGTPAVYISDNAAIGKDNLPSSSAEKLNPVDGNLYSYNNIKKNMYIYVVTPSKNTYNVHFNVGTGYTVNGTDEGNKITDNNATVSHGGTLNFKINVTTGYDKPTVIANNKLISLSSSENEYTGKLESVKEDTVVSITGNKKTYNVKLDESAKGSHREYKVNASEETIEHGGKYTFYVEPINGYDAPEVTYGKDEETATIVEPVNSTQYVITITGETTIYIKEGNPKQYNITYNEGDGYSFSSKPSTVSNGDTLTFILEVEKHYSNSKPIVSVGGKNQPARTQSEDTEGKKTYTYTVSDITSDQIVTVNGIQKNTYKVILTSGEGYTITTTENTDVTAENDFRFKVTPNLGYSAISVGSIHSSNGQNVEEANDGSGDYIIKNLNSDTNITVDSLSKKQYRAIITGDKHATVTAVSEYNLDDIKHGDTLKFTVISKDYYHVTRVLVNGDEKPAYNNVYTVSNVTDNIDIAVETKANTLTVTYVDEKYNTKIDDEVYTIEDDTEKFENKKTGKVKLHEIDDTKKLYDFIGWDNDNVAIDKNNDTKVTVTARWKIKEAFKSNSYVTLDTKGNFSKGFNNGQTSYTYKLSFHSLFKLAEELEEDLDNIAITGYGTFYSDKDITVDEDCFNSITDRKKEQSPTLYKAAVGDTSEHINNYYANVTGLYASDLNDTNNFFYLNIGANKEITRHAVGWIELTIGGETIIIYSQDISVTTGN